MEALIALAIFVVLMAAQHPITKRRHEKQGGKGGSLTGQYVSIGAMVLAVGLAFALLDGAARILVILAAMVAFFAANIALDRRSRY